MCSFERCLQPRSFTTGEAAQHNPFNCMPFTMASFKDISETKNLKDHDKFFLTFKMPECTFRERASGGNKIEL